MKYILMSLGLVAIMSCKQDQTRNKGIIPEEKNDHHKTMGNHEGGEAHGEEAGEHHENVAESAEVDVNGNYIYNVGEMFNLTLPDSTTIHIGKNSTEKQLFDQLSNANFTVSEDKTQNWITLDRVYFKTGSNELTAESAMQTKRIAMLMKAFPGTEFKLGGYTDNTGSQEINQPLSQKRAEAVMSQLGGLGVEANRLKAEGYGEQHPVCPANDTDACKAKNRRVDIRILKK